MSNKTKMNPEEKQTLERMDDYNKASDKAHNDYKKRMFEEYEEEGLTGLEFLICLATALAGAGFVLGLIFIRGAI